MTRQIEIEDGQARRTASLMGITIILALVIFGVMIMRGLAAPGL